MMTKVALSYGKY